MANCAMAKWGDRWVLAVHNDQAPTEPEWDRYLLLCNDAMNRTGEVRALVFTDGGGPTANQRKRLRVALGNRDSLTALITMPDQVMLRAVLAAVRLFNSSLAAYSCVEGRKALTHVGIGVDQADTVRDQARSLAREVGDVVSVKKVVF
jgi:hypothetical protein